MNDDWIDFILWMTLIIGGFAGMALAFYVLEEFFK